MTLLDDMLALLPDNFTGDISAGDMRVIVTDLYNLATGGSFQPLDPDLTTISGLIATTDNFIQSKASAWASRTPAQVAADLQGLVVINESQVTNLVTDLANKQPLDADLTTIAGLVATSDNFMQAKASAWASRTPAQVAADLQGLVTIAESQVTNLVTDLSNKQPLDSDLTTIAGLVATTDNFIQSKASAWASRTPAQVATDLQAAGLAPLASPTFTGTVTEPGVIRTGRTLRTYTVLTDAVTILVDASLNDHFTVTLGGNRTLGNPSNPPGAGQTQMIVFAIRQDGTGSRTLALDTSYRFGSDITSITLSTAINKTDYLGVRYNATDAKWDVIAFAKGY
jgi:hypothetical protein